MNTTSLWISNGHNSSICNSRSFSSKGFAKCMTQGIYNDFSLLFLFLFFPLSLLPPPSLSSHSLNFQTDLLPHVYKVMFSYCVGNHHHRVPHTPCPGWQAHLSFLSRSFLPSLDTNTTLQHPLHTHSLFLSHESHVHVCMLTKICNCMRKSYL